MIVDEHITAYLNSLEQEPEPFLEEMRMFAKEQKVPIIRREMESLFRVLLSLQKPERILEIGTGIAYSAIFLAMNGESVREIETIENYPPRIKIARKNLERYRDIYREQPQKISLLEEDAATAVRRQAELLNSDPEQKMKRFDLIFLDGPKAQYITMLPDLLTLLSKGGILLADNVLQDGELVRSRFATPRRERTIHERMRDFVWTVKHDPGLCTALLTVGDGVTVSVKQ